MNKFLINNLNPSMCFVLWPSTQSHLRDCQTWSQMCVSLRQTPALISLPPGQLRRTCVDGLIRDACWSVLDPRPFFSLLCKCWKTLSPQHCQGEFFFFFFYRRWTGTWERSFNLRGCIDTREQSSLLVLLLIFKCLIWLYVSL